MAEDLDKPLLDPENFNRDGIDLVSPSTKARHNINKSINQNLSTVPSSFFVFCFITNIVSVITEHKNTEQKKRFCHYN